MIDPGETERRLAEAARELRERFRLGFAPPREPAPEWQPRLQRFLPLLRPVGVEYAAIGLDDLQVVPLLQRVSGTRSHSNENGPGAFIPTRWGTSLNWSGAVLAATDGEVFDSVAASWVVPEPSLPAGESVDGREVGHGWQSSAWIGLDGYRGFSRGLPQIGTASVVDIAADPNDPSKRVARPYCYAWVQWWVRGKHFGEVRVNATKFPIEAGDRIAARMEVSGDRQAVSFEMTRYPVTGGPVRGLAVSWAAGRVEQKVLADTETLLEESKKPGSVDRSLAPAEGLHAVFCVERPLSLPAPGKPPALYPLPQIGEVFFTGAIAASRRPGAAIGREHDLSTARFVRMVGREDGARRTRFLTSPRPIVPRDEMLVRQL